MDPNQQVSKNLKVTELQVQTRLLLALWDLGGKEVKKSELMQRVSKSGGKASVYHATLDNLAKHQGVFISGKKVSLTSKGLERLNQGLQNTDFEFDTQVGAKTANALLKWIRQTQKANEETIAQINDGNAQEAFIESFEEFKEVVLDIYDRLNNDYNFDHLVPIYRIRRLIGNRVSRADFNSWLLKMQANDLLQLQGGSVEDSSSDKIEDSIRTEISGLRCYARRLV